MEQVCEEHIPLSLGHYTPVLMAMQSVEAAKLSYQQRTQGNCLDTAAAWDARILSRGSVHWLPSNALRLAAPHHSIGNAVEQKPAAKIAPISLDAQRRQLQRLVGP
jgi:hypothetical protein